MVSDKKIGKVSTNQNTLLALGAMLNFRSWLKSVQRFQRRRDKCEKLPDRRRTLTHDKSSPGHRKETVQLLYMKRLIYFKNGQSCFAPKAVITRFRWSCCSWFQNQRLPGACNRSPGSKLLSITTQLHCGSHLGGTAQLPDTILEEDHLMTIPSKFGSNWATGSRQDGFYVNFP